jgi:peptide/nickel transport system permease protein
MTIRLPRSGTGVLRLLAAGFLTLLILAAVLAPLIAPADPLAQNIMQKLASPSPQHLLGTDELGRDILSRLIYGARVELVVAVGATALAMVVGSLLGLLGGFLGGWVEFVSMRAVEVVLSFPAIVVALLFVTIYGPGQLTLIVVLGMLFTPAFARLVYGQTLSVKTAEYVEAAKVFGASTPRTLFRVVLPNVATPIAVQFPITIAAAILTGSGLSYLGLGIVAPTPSWGAMIATGQKLMSNDPLLLIIPSAVIALTVLAFGLVGDGLRDRLDPRARGKVRP